MDYIAVLTEYSSLRFMAKSSDNPNNDDRLTSHWPLPDNGVRQITPKPLVRQLSSHKLGHDLYPLGTGFYPHAHGHMMQRSEHSTYLMIYCSAGEGVISVAGTTQRVSPGVLILLPPGCAHKYHASDNKPWSIYWIHFAGDLAADYAGEVMQQEVLLDVGIHQAFIELFKRLFSMRRRGISLISYLQICAQLKLLLLTASAMTKQPAVDRTNQHSLIQALSYMRNHVNEDLNLDQLAGQCNLSKFHFVRKFKSLTGNSPIQYFIQLRMEQACLLLDNSSHSIKEIAVELGYQDPLYFSRLFKRVLGVSPKQYRSLHSA